MKNGLWQLCCDQLEDELSAQQFNTWIRPLQAQQEQGQLRLLAPNRFVLAWVEKQFFDQIEKLVLLHGGASAQVSLIIGGTQEVAGEISIDPLPAAIINNPGYVVGRLNPVFTFDSHVEGKSNQLARAAANQVGGNPGQSYNPLFLYGGVGLGKTHLMQAAGNLILQKKPGARVVYIHSERFVADMVRALQENKIAEFKHYYRSLDALLIDDIQFFSGKTHSQEEFFHTFNTLLEGQRQVVMTSDRFPKEISGVQERLISRFGSGLTVPIEAPELETRVAILTKKAASKEIDLDPAVAFFIAEQVRSNVRELEGALHRILASARFTGRAIDLSLAREALQDVMVFHERKVTINNIQKTVAEYFKMRVSDLHSKRRNRQITRPRQMAMALAKELTNHSLPDIGDAFGGRDHTTVLHACRKVEELIRADAKVGEDYNNLQKILSG